MVEGQGQTASLCTNVVSPISFGFFALKLRNLVKWMPLVKIWSLFLFRSCAQRSRLNCWADLHLKCCLILWLSNWWLPNFSTMFDFSKKIIPIALWVTRSWSNYWFSSQHCPLNILWTIRLIITKHGTVVAAREWIFHCIYADLLTFAPEEHVRFQTVLVLILVCPFNMVKAYIKYFKIIFVLVVWPY